LTNSKKIPRPRRGEKAISLISVNRRFHFVKMADPEPPARRLRTSRYSARIGAENRRVFFPAP
jgi:hypothetical protein